ncbi:MAG: hypothetical protein E6K91_05675 [Thaumarchaeota archaeon]|nr:MAG: hypothetical protein E6K91_05675 [Nitrososphaerota archaeon]
MRKIIRYSSLSYEPEEWTKKITWGDPDLPWYRGSLINEEGMRFTNVIPDNHIMYALVSKKTPTKMTIIPLERELEPKILEMNEGGVIYVGDGLIYFDTRLGDIRS